jgi:hypothetical protein
VPQGRQAAASQALLDRAGQINEKVRHLAICKHAPATRTLVWEVMEHDPAMPLFVWLLLTHTAADNHSPTQRPTCAGGKVAPATAGSAKAGGGAKKLPGKTPPTSEAAETESDLDVGRIAVQTFFPVSPQNCLHGALHQESGAATHFVSM